MTDDLFSFFNIPKTSIPERTSNDFETTLVKSIPYTQMSRGFEYEQFFLPNIIIDEIMYIINASNSPDEFLISFSNERLDLAIRNKFDIKDIKLSQYTQDTLKNLEKIGIEKNKDYKIVRYDCDKDEDAEELVFTYNGLIKYCENAKDHIDKLEPHLRQANVDSIEYATNQLNHIKVLQKKHEKAVAAEANFNKSRSPPSQKRWIF